MQRNSDKHPPPTLPVMIIQIHHYLYTDSMASLISTTLKFNTDTHTTFLSQKLLSIFALLHKLIEKQNLAK